MSVTIKDIAKEAGVAVVTVHRALNNKEYVGKETKEKILKIAQKLNYTPNQLAMSLVTKKTKTVGIIFPDTHDSLFPDIIQSVSDTLRKSGYSIVLCHSERDADKELEFIKQLKGQRVEGLLIYPVQKDNRYIEELKISNIPFVLINRHADELECDYVTSDNRFGAFLAISHLIKNGYIKITYLCAKPEASSGQERIEGCKNAFNANNIPEINFDTVTCQATIEDCYKKTKESLKNKKDLQALFVWDDKLAIGARLAVREMNLRVPEDIAIVGYNNIDISQFQSPPLTTVELSGVDIGAKAAQTLMEKIKLGSKSELKQIIIKPKLIIRKST
jgi:LacI family transcriptional regulator